MILYRDGRWLMILKMASDFTKTLPFSCSTMPSTVLSQGFDFSIAEKAESVNGRRVNTPFLSQREIVFIQKLQSLQLLS